MEADLAGKIARCFVADRLTKQWLMGIRRTWLKLMKPSISSWDDVIRAIEQLRAFVDNLRQEIRYNRPGAKGYLDDRFQAKLDKALDGLEEAIRSTLSTAKHWRRVDEDPETFGRGFFRKEEGEYMFERFRDHFVETVSTSEPVRGGHGRHQPVELTKLLDRALKLLREDAAVIQKHDEANPEAPFESESAFTEFAIGKMKVVIDDKTVTRGEINYYAKLLIEAKRRLEKRGFGKVWYGELFVRCKDCGGENEYGAELGVGGRYHAGPNTIKVFQRPGPSVVGLLVHELGHRWWFKHMSRANRLRFQDWIEAGLSPVSAYGGKKDIEAFAEVFSWYVLERPMTSEQATTFKMVSQGKGPAGRLAQRFMARARGKHYRYTDRELKRGNDPEVWEDSKRSLGGYNEYRIEIVPIRDIRVPKVWKPGRFEKARDRIESGKPIDPIHAVRKGGHWEIEDGIHRTNASKALGYTHIPVLTSTWIDTPEAVPETKPTLKPDTWVKMHKPVDGRQYGWIDEALGKPWRGITRYVVMLVKEGDDWPDFIDTNDSEFEPARPPPWGEATKKLTGY